MKKATNESMRIAGYIPQFLNEYAPSQKTNSANTLRSYQNALALYLTFLENGKKVKCTGLKGNCFTRIVIEEWIIWLKEKRGCSPESCNNRLSSLRVFLKFLGSRDIAYLYLYQEATGIPRQKCVKKKVDGLTREAVKTLMESPEPEAYVFYSRNTGIYGKMTQPAMDKVLKKHARIAHESCKDVPLSLHAHQLRHAKASHWLEDENDKKVSPKWKKADGSLVDFCGIPRKRLK